MAAKIAEPFGSVPMRTIDQHAIANNTPASVQFGAAGMAGWTSGMMVSADEYDTVVAKFLKSETGKRV